MKWEQEFKSQEYSEEDYVEVKIEKVCTDEIFIAWIYEKCKKKTA